MPEKIKAFGKHQPYFFITFSVNLETGATTGKTSEITARSCLISYGEYFACSDPQVLPSRVCIQEMKNSAPRLLIESQVYTALEQHECGTTDFMLV